MNGINRRGQKVVCIAEIEVEDGRGRVVIGPYPQVDEVYTVSDFIESGMIRAAEGDDCAPGISLVEVPTIRWRRKSSGQWVDLGWPLIAFRPLDERKTDISELLALGKLENVTEPA